jgi:hypothetical protein
MPRKNVKIKKSFLIWLSPIFSFLNSYFLGGHFVINISLHLEISITFLFLDPQHDLFQRKSFTYQKGHFSNFSSQEL